MISCTVLNLPSFMSKLLSTDCFDSFVLEEALIRMAATFHIDGRLNKDFYTPDEWSDPAIRPYDFMPWSDARRFCRDIIKGKRVPVSMQLVLELKPEFMKKTLEAQGAPGDAVSAFCLNVRLENGKMHLITGVSIKTFTVDRTPEQFWDKTIRRFLTAKDIAFEEDT